MVRLKYAKLLTVLVLAVNVILIFYTWKWFLSGDTSTNPSKTDAKAAHAAGHRQKDRAHTTIKHIKKTITIIFRDFYHFENDLHHSIDSILNLIPNIQIFVIYDAEPYPPLIFINNYTVTHPNVKFINLNFDIRKTAKALMPILQIRTKYALFVPDSFRFGGRAIIQKMLGEMEKKPSNKKDERTASIALDTKAHDSTASGDKVVQGQQANHPSDDSTDTITNTDKTKSIANKTAIKTIIIIPFASNVKTMSNCCRINIDIANWTMEYIVKNDTHHCDMFLQKHAILVDVNLLKTMPNALAAPFPEMFYVQAKMGKAKLHLLETGVLQDGKRLFTAFHNKQRRKEIRKQQFKEMYKLLEIKKVVRKYAGKSATKMEQHNKQHHHHHHHHHHHNGAQNEKNSAQQQQQQQQLQQMGQPQPSETIVLSNISLPLLTSIEYFGCEKNSRSCIGTVFDRKPFYVYLDRNTPPCCLEKLKSVFGHVLDELETVGIRYWLDNFALKSAIETNQLAHDAYEIDISFNSFDLERSQYLKKAQVRPITDAGGFYWIKATDGQYFRVQFSKQNQIGVNLLPFNMIGDRVRANGFFGWKAKEFSAEFLHPMSTVIFLNKNVMSPNNVRDFLDLKNIS